MDKLSASFFLLHLGLFTYFSLIFFIIRQIMIKAFINADILKDDKNHNSIKRMQFLGGRFDLKIVALFLAPAFIIAPLATIWLPYSNVLIGYSSYIFIVGFLLIAITIGNFYYFQTYQNHYDVFIFGLIEEDTNAVLKNIFDDYPIFRVILITFILSFIPAYLSIKSSQIKFETSILSYSLCFIIILIAMFIAMRGTINSKPLGKIHAQVSSLPIINKMVPNGIIAIHWAFQDRKRKVNFYPVDRQECEDLMNVLGIKSLYTKTPENEWLEKKKPNVILTVMESFGMNGLITDNQEYNDLLGSLRNYMESEFVFKRFLSSSNGTMSTLSSLYFHCPWQEISQSVEQTTPIKTTPFFVYKEKGYKTIFISAGNMMWRNLANYLPIQGVDELYDQNDLIEHYPEAKKELSYWGVPDEYAFKLAKELLEKADEPLFINILTITNHPPYKAPRSYTPHVVRHEVFENKIGNNASERKDILESFQYACNALGDFIRNVKNSNKGNNTIIAAVGDHHIRGMKYKMPEEHFLNYSVPFILSVPNEIKEEFRFDYSPQRLGSHKDIFPTLYHLSLSEAKYWSLMGENLLAPVTKNHFAYNPCVWATNSEIIDLESPDLISYRWLKDNDFIIDSLFSEQTSTANKEKIKAYQTLNAWQINYLLKGYKS